MAAAQEDQPSSRTSRTSRGELLIRGFNASVTGNAQAFGFSITVTATFGAITAVHNNPTGYQLMGFALSAVAAFSLLNVAAAVFFDSDRARVRATKALLVATATDFLAVGAGVGSAIGISHGLGAWPSWTVAPFAAGLVYVLVQAVEFALGQLETEGRGD